MKKAPVRKKPKTPPGGRTTRNIPHEAIYNNDPYYREKMASTVIRLLEAGELVVPVYAPVAKWLTFVLRTLLRDGKIPHLAKGRPTDTLKRYRRAGDLFLFLESSVRPTVKVALEDAADKLGPWVHTIYESPDFDVYRPLLRRAKAAKRRTKTPR